MGITGKLTTLIPPFLNCLASALLYISSRNLFLGVFFSISIGAVFSMRDSINIFDSQRIGISDSNIYCQSILDWLKY